MLAAAAAVGVVVAVGVVAAATVPNSQARSSTETAAEKSCSRL